MLSSLPSWRIAEAVEGGSKRRKKRMKEKRREKGHDIAIFTIVKSQGGDSEESERKNKRKEKRESRCGLGRVEGKEGGVRLHGRGRGHAGQRRGGGSRPSQPFSERERKKKMREKKEKTKRNKDILINFLKYDPNL